MALIFIDANGWLGFWKVGEGRHKGELIPAVLNLADHLFVPAQTAFEVERQKLSCFLSPVGTSKPQLPNAFPAHLIAAEDAKPWQDSRNAVGEEFKRLDNEWKRTLADVAHQISCSEDAVSIALRPILRAPVADTDDQLHRARLRRERGNPPGKQGGKLGDQICWEQILDHAHGTDVWLVSNDDDFSVLRGGNVFLNPFLRRELTERGAREVKVFRAVADMIREASAAGLDVRDAPAPERLEELAKEERRPERQLPLVAYGPEEGPCPICGRDTVVGPGARPGPYGFAWYSTCTSCGTLIYVDDYCD
jgi:hypothetical protein